MSHAIRVSDSEIEHLREAAALHSRSVAGQAEHWMRLGRLVEQSPGFDFRRADAALAAMDLGAEDREFQNSILASLELEQDPLAARSYAAVGNRPGAVGTDERGRLVERQEDGSLLVLAGE